MPRVNTPSPKKNRNRNNRNNENENDDDFEAMPLKHSMNVLMSMTQGTVRGLSNNINNNQTGELENFIHRIMEMNQDEIKSELQKSFNNNDEQRFKRLIKGLFRGYQNFSHHWLALQKNNKYDGKHQIDDHEQDIIDDDDDEDEDEIMNRKNSKKGESSFMNKSVTFFKEFCKLINSPNTTKEESNWINKAISIYLDEVK